MSYATHSGRTVFLTPCNDDANATFALSPGPGRGAVDRSLHMAQRSTNINISSPHWPVPRHQSKCAPGRLLCHTGFMLAGGHQYSQGPPIVTFSGLSTQKRIFWMRQFSMSSGSLCENNITLYVGLALSAEPDRHAI